MFDEFVFMIIPFIMFFLFFGIGILGTLFWLWILIDCAMKEPSEGNDKLIWIIVIIFTHLLGALVYFFVRRPKRIEEYGR
ncbi:PLDc N-terminal domain-containing protein [Methanolobus mangrovi]|uniref:PLDc N-terminal domain-containing protein n=1 Tax=Methanolobus mangrovi TaxID=3072977 RepID=A0AA51YI98_9EURY|nr:PLDc N-terminal domain-containing protein [Methanolobus mangrovi]WMW21318.1 PLDc N-terminal domain-containing protein [Methanolobus mangrovi]